VFIKWHVYELDSDVKVNHVLLSR